MYLLSDGDWSGRRGQDGSYLRGTTFFYFFWIGLLAINTNLIFLSFILTFCFSAVHFFTSLARDVAVE